MSDKYKYELLKELMITGHLDINWTIKNILGFDTKALYRKAKINRMFNV
jgi:hypothetical protein